LQRAPDEPHPCAGPSPVEARYLLAILDLERSAGAPTQAEVARSVGVAAPTALEMIRRLRGLGFVEPDAIALTHAGQSAALVLSSRRAAAHALVHDVLGIDDELSRREADHLATAVSPSLGRRLLAGRERPPRPHA
jgi:DtxR family transcriptional regulator, Mn-dependent transcriptional regulator